MNFLIWSSHCQMVQCCHHLLNRLLPYDLSRHC